MQDEHRSHSDMLSEYGLQVCAAKWRLRPRSIRADKIFANCTGSDEPVRLSDKMPVFLFCSTF